MKPLILILILLLLASPLSAADTTPSTPAQTASQAGSSSPWSITSGTAAASDMLVSEVPAKILGATWNEPLATPTQITLRLKLAGSARARIILTQADTSPQADASKQADVAKPLLAVDMLRAGDAVRLNVNADGKPMAAQTSTDKPWTMDSTQNVGTATYQWRFNQVSNLWDDRDRAEIGSAYEQLTHFDDKLFVLRLVITETSRQIWLDDRLIAEETVATTGKLSLNIDLIQGASVASTQIDQPKLTPGYVALSLDDYATDGALRQALPVVHEGAVPLRQTAGDGLDLGKTIYRYRLTDGSGPGAPYVNGKRAYPSPLTVDPQLLALRVPYRDYQNIYLLAWIDKDASSVPAGTVRFYREEAGYTASTDFQIDDKAIAQGLVKKLDQTTKDGKQLYLVRVPVDTKGFAGFADMASEFLDMEISKPVMLARSYPDPIYYGSHPAGLPSSVHVVGITLEQGPFGYTLTPKNFADVFEASEPAAYTVHIKNHTGKALPAKVTIHATSYDGSYETTAQAQATVNGESLDVPVAFAKLKKLGWYKLDITVDAGGVQRTSTSSLVTLPPDTRTYGNAMNETRIGAWMLLGHHTALVAKPEKNIHILKMMRRIGVRRIGTHSSFFDMNEARKLDFLPNGPHTIVSVFHRLDITKPADVQKMVDDEVKAMEEATSIYKESTYFYGGEWNFDHRYAYMANPRYTGGDPFVLDDAALINIKRQMTIFEAVGTALRKSAPDAKLILQWGSPLNTIGFMEQDFPKELVDMYGMDAPMFELTPEAPNITGGVNQLWTLRQEQKRLGWPELDINWTEGPFFPTNPGALTEAVQAQNHIRYWLLGLSYGVETFESGVVVQDAGNYYGAEHYGAGIFHRIPLNNPKPAVAAINTATTMLCGADLTEKPDTGVPTTFAMGFNHKATQTMRYALWRVVGEVDATIDVSADKTGEAAVTDSMGNTTKLPVKDGKITVTIGPLPVWLTGVSKINSFTFAGPRYTDKPADITAKLSDFTTDGWKYDGEANEHYANNHMGIARVTDGNLTVRFGQQSPHGAAAVVHLPVEPLDDRPVASRYGTIVPAKPIEIPGKANALGVWIEGNSSWGRIVYQLRDAKGQLWTSIGSKDAWNCDDTHTWSYVKHDGWRYVRFPLPGNEPWDGARDLETTWWKSEGGDGVVALPLRVERIMVEARNATQVVGDLKIIPIRDYKIAGLVAEYDSSQLQSPAAVALSKIHMPAAKWSGPDTNPMAELRKTGSGSAPAIDGFDEPVQWNDGRNMIVRFKQDEGMKYQLYLSRYEDGRGAEPMRGYYTDNQMVRGLRPGIDMYMFLVGIDAKGEKTKPSPSFKLVTVDKFAEK